MEQKRTCPECHLIFETPRPETDVLACPLCNTVFAVSPPEAAPRPVSATPPRAIPARHAFKGCVAVTVLLFLAGGLVYGYRLLGGLGPKAIPPPITTAPPTVSPSLEAPLVVETVPAPPPPPRVREPRAHRLASATKPPDLAVEPRRPPPLPERVNLAIDQGVAYLRQHHAGHEQYRRYLGLLGLTLLECGIPAADPSVRQIASLLRKAEYELANTYELSLAILFLDRLNDSRDRALIRTFGQRLLLGQCADGTWTYSCLVRGQWRRDRRPDPASPGQPRIISWRNAAPIPNLAPLRPVRVSHGDTSNTQFALLALWIAQRYGVATRPTLLAADQYFRNTQSPDGSWTYHPNVAIYRDSTTCAGLLGLAMHHGVLAGQGRNGSPGRSARVRDPAIDWGLRFLGQSLNKVELADGRIKGVDARDPLYFLWSLERMAVIYDLKKIGDREWYPWAARLLVEVQHRDGSWSAPYGEGPIGTCFALLILKRSNVAPDLQLAVQDKPPRRDLGPTVIQSGQTGLRGTAVEVAPLPPLGPTTIQGPRAAPANK